VNLAAAKRCKSCVVGGTQFKSIIRFYIHMCKKLVVAFSRKLVLELTLGRLVGKGGFSLVFEVVKLEVEEVYDISKRSASERREVAKESIDENGMPRFAVKLLRDDLIDEEHSKGVIDLAVEARFLRRLSHPNIIAMR
jgi:hypothetical protein